MLMQTSFLFYAYRTCNLQRNLSATRKRGNCNALQLEAGRRRAVPIRFNFVARPKFEVAQPICCRLRAFLLLIRTLRCDLEL